MSFIKNSFWLLSFSLMFSCSSLKKNPALIHFQSVQFQVFTKGKLQVLRLGEEVFALGTGDIFIYDFDKDGNEDFCLYRKNDDMDDHFGYIDVYINTAETKSLDDLQGIEGKFKEGHWAWIDTDKYPGVNDDAFLSLIKGIESNVLE
jgi:hypothetical protein